MKLKIERFFSDRNFQVLLGITFLGFLVRVWGIDWGLPEVFEEATPMRKAWGFWGWENGTFDLNPHFFNYPAFYFYIQFFVQILYYLFGLLTGLYSSLADFRIHFEQDPSTIVILSRFTTTVFGTITLIVAFVLGKRMWGERVGLLAAFFLAFNTLHVIYSKRISVDVPLTFLILCGFVYILMIYERSRRRDYLLAGLFTGLATATKYTGAFLLIPLIVAHFLSEEKHKKRIIHYIFDGKIVIGVFLAGLFFFIVSPFCLLDFNSFWEDFSFERAHMSVGHFGSEGVGFSWFDYLVTSFRRSMGLPLQFLALFGVLYALYRHERRDLLFLCFPLLYFLVVGSWSMRTDRYLLPMIPFLLILAARFLYDVIQSIRLKQSVKEILFITGAVLLIVHPGIQIASLQSQYTRPDTRTLAKSWIEENVPQQSLIALEQYGPVLDTERYGSVEIPLYSVEPEYTVPFYDLRWFDTFDYIVVSSLVYDRYMRQPEKYEVQNAFYRDLENQFKLVQRFDETTGTGPTIKIYKNTQEKPEFDSSVNEAMESLFEKLNINEKFYKEGVPRFLKALVIALYHADEKDRSEKILQKLLEIDPGDAQTNYNLGFIYYEKELYDKAIVMCTKVLEYDPDYTDAHYLLAVCFENTGRLDGAIHHYKKVLEARPRFVEVHMRLGITYEKQRDFKKAKEIWERILKMDPSNILAAEKVREFSEKGF